MSHIILNNSHHLVITSNDEKYKLVIDRVVCRTSQVFDGKKWSAPYSEHGYTVAIYGIKKEHQNDERGRFGFYRYDNRLSWGQGDKKHNLKRFKEANKKQMVDRLETFMNGIFTEAVKEIRKK